MVNVKDLYAVCTEEQLIPWKDKSAMIKFSFHLEVAGSRQLDYPVCKNG